MTDRVGGGNGGHVSEGRKQFNGEIASEADVTQLAVIIGVVEKPCVCLSNSNYLARDGRRGGPARRLHRGESQFMVLN